MGGVDGVSGWDGGVGGIFSNPEPQEEFSQEFCLRQSIITAQDGGGEHIVPEAERKRQGKTKE